MSGPTLLQSKLAAQIILHARLAGWHPGHHVTEDSLLPLLGTSRTPVRAAMALLAERGVLEQRPNRGFFIRQLPSADEAREAEGEEGGDEKLYYAIAMDRLSQVLPDTISENELMRRYGVSRAQIRLVLTRIASEGWVERRPGRGWAFQSTVDSLNAYRENYRFRQMLEPTAMRSPEFRVDVERVRELAQQQVMIRDGGYRTMSRAEYYEVNARFHEGLAEMSHNRYVVQALARMNHLRRLTEYGWALDRTRVRRVCEEHLGILAALEAGNVGLAADRLEKHLTSAAVEKAIEASRKEEGR